MPLLRDLLQERQMLMEDAQQLRSELLECICRLQQSLVLVEQQNKDAAEHVRHSLNSSGAQARPHDGQLNCTGNEISLPG